MKSAFGLALAGLVLFAVRLQAACNCTEELFPQPSYHLGYADGRGHFNLWRSIAEVEFTGDVKIPLRAYYSVDNGNGATFGAGWTVPLLESTAIPQSESWIDMMTPGGAHIYLVRQKDDHSHYVSGNQKWSGVLSKEGNLTVTGPRMWQFSYTQGRLQQVKTGDGDVLTWQYNGDHAMSISKAGSGVKLSVEYSPGNPQPVAFLINGQRYPLAFGKIPTVSTEKGVPLVHGFQTTLQSVTKPDQTKETYDFDFLPEGKYRLAHSDFEGKHRVFTWDPGTKQLISDGTYTYKTTQKGESDPLVSRYDSKGRQEFFYYDTGLGATIHRKFNGVITRRHFMLAQGANYLNLRKVESQANPKAAWVASLINSYDEKGHLIRSIMGDESVAQTWWPNGKMASLVREKAGKTVFQKQFNQLGQVTEYQFGDNVIKYAYDGKMQVAQRYLNGKLFSTLVENGDFRHTVSIAADAAGKQAANVVQSTLPGVTVSQADARAALALVQKVNAANEVRQKNSH